MSSIQLSEFFLHIQEKFKEFIIQLQIDHNIPEKTLLRILEQDEFQNFAAGIEFSKVTKKPVKSTKPKEEPAGECMAVVKSGIRKGQACGKKISDKSDTGRYCGVHAKLEQTPEAIKKKEEDELDGILFLKNKYNNYAFGDTGLILESDTVRKVIGRQLPDGNILDLTNDDIALCKLRKLKFIRNYSGRNLPQDSVSGSEVLEGASTVEHTSKMSL